ncbi:MAG: membrane protein insertase YidC [Proteobacteria bacterium]|nr:membrane protein insertase YidC [Pseudomonadota bacterium]
MDFQRLILLFVFSFSVLMLWDAWEKHQRPKPTLAAASKSAGSTIPSPSLPKKPQAPSVAVGKAPAVTAVPGVPSPVAQQRETIVVRTDVLGVEIDSQGGTLRRVELFKHKDSIDPKKNFVFLGPEHSYFAQSGITGDAGPNHRTVWRVLPGPRELAKDADRLEVRLAAETGTGLAVQKVYTFARASYEIGVAFEITNNGTTAVQPHAYFQLVRDEKSPTGESAMMQTFTGPVYFTDEKKYVKVSFEDVAKGKADLPKQSVTDGWIGIVQHYFVSAWLPPEKVSREFYTRKLPDGHFAVGAILGMGEIAAGAKDRVETRLYAGPQELRRLEAMSAPGLDLVVDFGWLTVIAKPLFWLLEKYHAISGNWGAAIVLLTITIKLVFFPLSAASYKSMAKMKLVTPRLTKIREMYGNDRQKMNQAMMELYKTEKINPLGGCFPILVQIPVFIALYWTLLAAIELRHAPFILWIKDLSALDPYYVLPVLMAATMILQTRMNPVPPDPVQAKVMQFMPYVFSIFFFFFPAGLVLYWLVNNILSIAQQWQIQRMFERDKTAHARR